MGIGECRESKSWILEQEHLDIPDRSALPLPPVVEGVLSRRCNLKFEHIRVLGSDGITITVSKFGYGCQAGNLPHPGGGG